MIDRGDRGDGVVSLAGCTLIATGVVLCVITHAGRLDEDAEADMLRNRRAHGCEKPECSVCPALRDWVARNPDRSPSDLADLAEDNISGVRVTGNQALVAHDDREIEEIEEERDALFVSRGDD